MKTMALKSLREAGWAPLLVVAFYAVAAKVFNAYIVYPNLDMPTHFCGGLAITYFFIVSIWHAQAWIGPIPRSIRLLLALGLTVMAAVFWEFLEFLSDHWHWMEVKMNLGVSDTLSDLFFGSMGGLVAVLLAIWFCRKEPKAIRSACAAVR